jgi:hypothetical protein
MVSEFRLFHTNPHKSRCRLEIGSTFILRGYYCQVTRMFQNHFEYWIQETEFTIAMSYKDYLTTPSAAGRQLNVNPYK